MKEVRRRAYLEALGIEAWVLKPPEPERHRLQLSPGQGSTLLICAAAEDSVSRLAADIVRAIGSEPVWSWPDPEGGAESPEVGEAVGQQMFTRVIVFGASLAGQVFRGEAPGICGSARVFVAPELGEVAVRGKAKQALWKLLAVPAAG